MKNYKKYLSILLVLGLSASLTACLDDDYEDYEYYDEEDGDQGSRPDIADEYAQDTDASDWAIYWYICGSDLESEGGAATTDLEELMSVDLPEDVTFVIETGGANSWESSDMDPDMLQRWVYDSNGSLELVDEQKPANMGDSKTLADFLSFASTNYPASKTAVVFWNHGGGSVTGVSFDELYDYDSLTLKEIYQAFNQVWTPNTENPALEMVGFDTCLMATIDTAYALSPFAHYMVASEETEPGSGWDYSAWVQELADHPSMNGAMLGQYICTTYEDSLRYDEEELSIATLSVTDLKKADTLFAAYEAFGEEALKDASSDPSFYAQFSKTAKETENYGGNTKSEGYTNMMDLGDFATKTKWLLPSAQAVIDALDQCIIYNIGGDYRRASGLSCYYSYNSDMDDLLGYLDQGAGSAFKCLYYYQLTGEMPSTLEDYVASAAQSSDDYMDTLDLNEDDFVEAASFEDTDWDGIVPDIDEEGYAVLNLGPEANDILSDITFELYLVDEEEDYLLAMGTDNDIDADWEHGIFKDNFRGVWGSLDDIPVYMELYGGGDDYNLYTVPILLNDEEYNLHVSYEYDDDSWKILGASKGLDDHGMASKEMRKLKEGDVIDILYYEASLSDDDDFESYIYDTITYSKKTQFTETDLFIGTYAMIFVMTDSTNNQLYSDAIYFEIDEDGEIYTYE